MTYGVLVKHIFLLDDDFAAKWRVGDDDVKKSDAIFVIDLGGFDLE